MRVTIRSLVSAAVLALALAACSSGPNIRTDVDPAANFAGFETFGFFDPLATDKAGYSTLLTARLKDAARRELEARGYRYDQASPDLLVNFNVNVVDKTEVSSTPSMSAGYGYYGYRAGMYGAWSGYPYDVTTTNYKQGTLTIDAVDAERKALVWQGVAEGRIKKEVMKNPAPAIDAAVAQIFQSFPSRGGAPAAAQ
jgi:hypothetical protein